MCPLLFLFLGNMSGNILRTHEIKDDNFPLDINKWVFSLMQHHIKLPVTLTEDKSCETFDLPLDTFANIDDHT